MLERAAQSTARERRVGHARQLPRRADRLPAARRAARLDRRHPGIRSDRRVPVRLRRLPGLLAGRPGCEQQNPTASCRSSCPTCSRPDSGRAAAAWGDAAVIVPWVLHERFGDREIWPSQYPSMRAWVEQIWPRSPANAPVGRRLPVRRLARPGRSAGPARRTPRPTPTSSPPPTSPAPPTSSPAPHAARHDRRRRPATRLGRAVRTASWTSTSLPPVGCLSDAQTAYALAIEFGLAHQRPGPTDG